MISYGTPYVATTTGAQYIPRFPDPDPQRPGHVLCFPVEWGFNPGPFSFPLSWWEAGLMVPAKEKEGTVANG